MAISTGKRRNCLVGGLLAGKLSCGSSKVRDVGVSTVIRLFCAFFTLFLTRLVALFFVGFFSLSSNASSTSEKVFYRYVNETGVKVINFSVPPQYVKNGYEILNLHGQVIRRVERQKTKEELAKEAELQRINEMERNLQRRYSSSQELEQAKVRRLAEVTSQIRMEEGNIALLTSQLNKERLKAAKKERNGVGVPESIQINIDNIKRKRDDARRRVARLKQNYKDVESMFERDIATYDRIEKKRTENIANFTTSMSVAKSKSSM